MVSGTGATLRAGPPRLARLGSGVTATGSGGSWTGDRGRCSGAVLGAGDRTRPVDQPGNRVITCLYKGTALVPKLSVVTEFSGTTRPEATPATALRPPAAPVRAATPAPRPAGDRPVPDRCGVPTVPLARTDARPLDPAPSTGPDRPETRSTAGPRPPEGSSAAHPRRSEGAAARPHEGSPTADPPTPAGPAAARPHPHAGSADARPPQGSPAGDRPAPTSSAPSPESPTAARPHPATGRAAAPPPQGSPAADRPAPESPESSAAAHPPSPEDPNTARPHPPAGPACARTPAGPAPTHPQQPGLSPTTPPPHPAAPPGATGAPTAPRPTRWEPATAPIPATPTTGPGPIIDAAVALVAEHGARGLRVADVASRAGVSRQTVYNEHGNKQRLVEAVALVKTAEFVDAARACLARSPGAVEGVAEAVRQVHALTRLDPLARSVLTGTDADDMLPMLTTRGGWVLDLVAPAIGEHLARHRPDLPPARIAFAADVLTRLALSHLLTPDHGPDRAVDRAADCAVEAVTVVAAALLGPSPQRAG
ncbi:TetR family transcriptional regulator [Actinosynnema pretiosum]|uniref:TetR family transcriptional regulator n=2 Tax=Pseudonocardiaceae TaxID=2070 RepID=UPI002646EC32|nr:TetR family transcriptional regulator [Actinosynnema pretiosum]